MDLGSRVAPVVEFGVPLDHIANALRERPLVGRGLDSDIDQLAHVLLEERRADHCPVGNGWVRAPIVIGNASAPQRPLCRLLSHSGVEGAPDLVDQLWVDLEPVLVVLLATGVGCNQPLVHQVARFSVRNPDVVVDVRHPHLGDLGIRDVQAVLFDGMQGDELDVGVVVAERAAKRLGHERYESPPVSRIDLQFRAAVVIGGIHPVDQYGDRLLDIVVLERKPDVVAEELPDPEP